MSRGLGSLQRDILAHLQTAGGVSTLESARWAVHVGAGNSVDLPKAWAYSVGRAMRRLASVSQGRQLTIEKRPLATLQEWVTHYPGKTHSSAVRQLRLDLLPVLVEWVRGDGGPGPLFSADENEQYHAKKEFRHVLLRRTTDSTQPFAHEWKAFEAQLRPYLAQPDSDDLFYLVARGKMLFLREPIETKSSFGEVLKRCETKQLLPAGLIAQLRSLADRFFPPAAVNRLELKSSLYPCVTSVIHGHCELKPEAVEALYKAQPGYLTAVPGFHQPEPRKPGVLYIDDNPWNGRFDKGSLLSRLIDQTAYQKFHFIRLSG